MKFKFLPKALPSNDDEVMRAALMMASKLPEREKFPDRIDEKHDFENARRKVGDCVRLALNEKELQQ